MQLSANGSLIMMIHTPGELSMIGVSPLDATLLLTQRTCASFQAGPEHRTALMHTLGSPIEM